MSELARRRNARDMWISRGHLAAAASGTASLAVASFAIGLFVGEHRRVSVTEPEPFAPDEGVVELLARIETTAALPGGVDDALTFPDLLQGEAVPRVPDADPPHHGRIALDAPAGRGRVEQHADPPPVGQFTVVVGRGEDPAAVRGEVSALRQRGLAAWVSVVLVDGVPTYRIGVGGFPDEASARDALGIARAAGVPGAVEPIVIAPTPRAPRPAPVIQPVPVPSPTPPSGEEPGGPAADEVPGTDGVAPEAEGPGLVEPLPDLQPPEP